MATADLIQEQEEQEQEHLGGGRFNRLLGVVFVAVAMARRSGTCPRSAVLRNEPKFRFPEISRRPRLSSPKPGRNRRLRSAWRGAACGTDRDAN